MQYLAWSDIKLVATGAVRSLSSTTERLWQRVLVSLIITGMPLGEGKPLAPHNHSFANVAIIPASLPMPTLSALYVVGLFGMCYYI